MEQDTEAPLVLILQQAMDVIRRESLKSEVETGGILIGSRSKDGAMLVTHATPPGPNAVHHDYSFQRDVPFQQDILNRLHQRYGVNYLGEWHKHPRTLNCPSGGDLRGVRDLLNDPDYGVEAILFPIIICERDFGFQFHPYFISGRDLRFRPFEFHEVTFPTETDQAFSFDEESLREHLGGAGDAVYPEEELPHQKSEPSSVDAGKQQTLTTLNKWVEKLWLPFLGGEKPKTTPQVDSEGHAAAEAENGTKSQATEQWYATAAGRKRLADENQLLHSFALASEPFRLKNGVLGFAFPRGGGREITIVCPSNYPKGAPTVFVKADPHSKPVRYAVAQWSDNRRLAELVVPLLGPNHDNQNSNQKGESL